MPVITRLKDEITNPIEGIVIQNMTDADSNSGSRKRMDKILICWARC